MDDAEDPVTVLHRLSYDSHGVEVIDLFHSDVLAEQLFLHAVQPLDAALHLGADSCLPQLVADDLLDSRQEGLAGLAARFYRFADLFVPDGVHIAKSQIFQLATNLAHPQPVRDGSVNVQRLLGNLFAALGRKVLERPHIVQSIGKLDQHHPDVIYHGKHHLAEIFSLLFLTGGKIDGTDFSDTFNNVRDLLAKFFADIDDRY